MPKRPADERGNGRSAKLPTQQRKHLYLVLDDWELGYSIRKVDLLSDFDSIEADGGGTINRTEQQRLPPAVFRLEAPHACTGQFTAFGTKIMFLGMLDSPWGTALMYDVRTRALTSAPRREMEPSPYNFAYVQVDGKLFALDDGGFEMLQPPPPPLDSARSKVKIDWSWCALPSPSYHYAVSYAMHPDGKTMVFSMVKRSLKKGTRLATLSFDIETSQWTRHGAWELPFKGRGYFDHDLDAWVGLSSDPNTLGHLCCCDVLSADNNSKQPPAFKLSKEKLFCVDPAEKHIGATLVYVGDDRARFCLVQFLSIDIRQGGIWKESMPEHRCHVLRVTTFSLKYDKYGDLQTAKYRHIGSYRLPEIARVYCYGLEGPVVFWILSLINRFHQQLMMQRVNKLQVESR